MLNRPDVAIRVTPAPTGTGFEGSGRMSDRAVAFAHHFSQRAIKEGLISQVPAAHLRVLRVPKPHAGLGSGTQLAMAVAKALVRLINCNDMGASAMARLVGRGQRSAVGAHGSVHGGLIVDGGKIQMSGLAPLVARLAFPSRWRIVLVRPNALHGLAGEREQQAFVKLPPISPQLTARMCQLALLGLLPALVEADLDQFGEALYELQQLAGESFKAAQGGLYAAPLLAEVVQHVRGCGIRGVGQSSWGPTLYAVTANELVAGELAADLRERFAFGHEEVLITRADNQGSRVMQVDPAPPTAQS